MDDEERVIQQFINLLQPLDYHLESARDGREAQVKLASAPFDLLILDVMMPYVDGVEVLKAVRQRPGLSRIPVLMLTALSSLVTANQSQRGWLRDLGADECLVKSKFTSNDVIATVQRLLAKKAE